MWFPWKLILNIVQLKIYFISLPLKAPAANKMLSSAIPYSSEGDEKRHGRRGDNRRPQKSAERPTAQESAFNAEFKSTEGIESFEDFEKMPPITEKLWKGICQYGNSLTFQLRFVRNIQAILLLVDKF